MASSVFIDPSGITTTGTSIVFPIDFSVTITQDTIGVTSTDGLVLRNTTAAAAGAQQMPGRFRFDGFGWKTDATAASQAVSFINEMLPVQGTSAPTANLLWKYAVNGGAYGTQMTLTSAGSLTIGGTLTAGGSVAVTDAGYVGASAGRSLMRFPGVGQFSLLNFGESAGVGLDVATDAILKVRTRAQTGYADLYASGLRVGDGTSTPGGIIVAGQISENSGGTGATVDVGRLASGRTTITGPTLGNTSLAITSPATNDDPIVNVQQNRVATTDATVTTIHTIAIPTSTTVGICAYITARRTGGVAGAAEDGAMYRAEAVYKNVAGTATEIAEVITVIGESQAGWTVAFTPSSGNALIQVTGAVDNNITWHASKIEVMPVGS